MIQAISRARGDEETEKNPKELHFVYPIYPQWDALFERILEYEPKADEQILRLMITKAYAKSKASFGPGCFWHSGAVCQKWQRKGACSTAKPIRHQIHTQRGGRYGGLFELFGKHCSLCGRQGKERRKWKIYTTPFFLPFL
jgi:hypothetical protein